MKVDRCPACGAENSHDKALCEWCGADTTPATTIRHNTSLRLWKKLLLQITCAFSLYAIAKHIIIPIPMTLTLYSPLKIFAFYFGSYLTFFLATYLFVSLFVMPIVFLRFKRGKEITPIPITLGRILLPTLFLLGLAIYGQWYGATHLEAWNMPIDRSKIVWDTPAADAPIDASKVVWDTPVPEDLRSLGKSVAEKSRVAPVIAMSTIQDAEGLTEDDFTVEGLKNIETWSVAMILQKARQAHVEAGNDPSGFTMFPESQSLFLSVDEKKLALVKITLYPSENDHSDTTKMVRIFGFTRRGLESVACIRASNHDIQIWSGVCGDKIREVFGVRMQFGKDSNKTAP